MAKSSKKNQDLEENNKPIKKNVKKDNKIFEIKTTQTGAFKQVIERIGSVISECCMVIIPPDNNIPVTDEYYEEVNENHKHDKKKNNDNQNVSNRHHTAEQNLNNEDIDTQHNTKKKDAKKKNTGGIRILRLTEDKSILIKLNLDAINFESFRCDETKVTIGIDMQHLHNLLKLINDEDPIVMFMNKDNRGKLYIRSINENNDSSEETHIELNLMEIANPDMPIPQTEFQNKITMASDKFHNICKHLNNNSTFVEITSINNEILFRGQNEGGKVTMSYKDVNYIKKKDKSDQVVQGIYELRNLMSFSKCNKLCQVIEIYLRNDFPLVLVIAVATLGKMYVFLSPIENPTN